MIWSFEGEQVPYQDDNNEGMVLGFFEMGMSPCFCIQESCLFGKVTKNRQKKIFTG